MIKGNLLMWIHSQMLSETLCKNCILAHSLLKIRVKNIDSDRAHIIIVDKFDKAKMNHVLKAS